MTDFESAKKPIPVALALGFLGGAALIMTTELTTNPEISPRNFFLSKAKIKWRRKRT